MIYYNHDTYCSKIDKELVFKYLNLTGKRDALAVHPEAPGCAALGVGGQSPLKGAQHWGLGRSPNGG